jgi:hypothetical protein
MAIDALSLALATTLSTTPAPNPDLDLSLIAPVPVTLAAAEPLPGTVDLALASSCRSPWYTFSGIQLITCVIARPEEFFGPADNEE